MTNFNRIENSDSIMNIDIQTTLVGAKGRPPPKYAIFGLKAVKTLWAQEKLLSLPSLARKIKLGSFPE